MVKRLLYVPRGGEVMADASSLRYKIKALIEQANFAAVTAVHDLPAIHGYWTGPMRTRILASPGGPSRQARNLTRSSTLPSPSTLRLCPPVRKSAR